MSNLLIAMGIGIGTALSLPILYFGVMKIKEMLDNFLKIKKGFVESYIVLGNRRIIKGLVKPDGEELKIKIGNKTKTLQFDEKMCIFEGNKPIIFYSEASTKPYDFYKGGKQILEPSYYDSLLAKMRNIGAKLNTGQDQILMILVGLAIFFAFVGIIFGFLNYSAILKIPV